MSKATIERGFIVSSPITEVWARLIEVERVAAWLPILHTVTELEPLVRYDALLEDRVGPFAMRADLQISVLQVDEPNSIAVIARGEDRQVRSQISIEAAVHLSQVDPSTTNVTVSGTYEITGKVATLGASTIRSKANKLVDQFCSSAQTGLG